MKENDVLELLHATKLALPNLFPFGSLYQPQHLWSCQLRVLRSTTSTLAAKKQGISFEPNRQRFDESRVRKQEKALDRGRRWETNLTTGLEALRLALNIKRVSWQKPENVLQPVPKTGKPYEGAMEKELERKVVQFSWGIGGRLEADKQAFWKLKLLNLERTHKQVKEHYNNYLRPEIKKDDWNME